MSCTSSGHRTAYLPNPERESLWLTLVCSPHLTYWTRTSRATTPLHLSIIYHIATTDYWTHTGRDSAFEDTYRSISFNPRGRRNPGGISFTDKGIYTYPFYSIYPIDIKARWQRAAITTTCSRCVSPSGVRDAGRVCIDYVGSIDR